MSAIRKTVTSCVVKFPEPRNVCEIGAPKNLASAACCANSGVNVPRACGGFFPIPFRTVKSAKNIGASGDHLYISVGSSSSLARELLVRVVI